MTDPAPYITAFHRRSIGAQPDLRHVDFVTAFGQDTSLLAAARAELKALEQRGRARSYSGQEFGGDHEGKIRHRALSRMLEQFDARGT